VSKRLNLPRLEGLREVRMRHLKSGFLTLAVCATAVASVVAASEAGASGRHIKKHYQRTSHHHYRTSYGFNDVPTTGGIAPVAAPYARRSVCPGMGRSFDCSVWPPPFDEDPDRKVSGSDGG
jgi:hypothetical protein